MKLKRLFLVKTKKGIIPLALCFILISCTSNNLTVPVPGQSGAKLRNIYVEYYNLGESYYKLEDYKKAAEYYELAMRKKDQYWASYYKLAKCYVFTSEWNNALPMYKKILQRDGANDSIKASIAYIYSMQGNYKQAKKLYQELIDSQPTNQDYLENYIAILIADEKRFKKNSELYLQLYEKLKTEYPENKNLTTFDEKYKTLMEIEDEGTEESEDEDVEDENEDGETEGEGEKSSPDSSPSTDDTSQNQL